MKRKIRKRATRELTTMIKKIISFNLIVLCCFFAPFIYAARTSLAYKVCQDSDESEHCIALGQSGVCKMDTNPKSPFYNELYCETDNRFKPITRS